MSLMSAAELAAKQDDPGQATPDNKWYGQLVALVPTEAIGVFTGALAFCVGIGWGWGVRWIILGVVAIFCVPWVWLNYWGSLTPEQKHAKQFPIPYWAIGMGVIAFGVWSLTIPETPFLQWHRWDLKFAPFVTLVGVTLLTIADRIRAAVKERETPLPQQLSG